MLPDVLWFGADGNPVDWTKDDSGLTCLLGAPLDPAKPTEPARGLLLMLHSGTAPRTFVIPSIANAYAWRLLVNTAADTPNDIFPELDGPRPPAGGRIVLVERSTVAWISDPMTAPLPASISKAVWAPNDVVPARKI
jgi:glycogen operon protein